MAFLPRATLLTSIRSRRFTHVCTLSLCRSISLRLSSWVALDYKAGTYNITASYCSFPQRCCLVRLLMLMLEDHAHVHSGVRQLFSNYSSLVSKLECLTIVLLVYSRSFSYLQTLPCYTVSSQHLDCLLRWRLQKKPLRAPIFRHIHPSSSSLIRCSFQGKTETGSIPNLFNFFHVFESE